MNKFLTISLTFLTFFLLLISPAQANTEKKLEVITATVVSYENGIIKLSGEGSFLPAQNVEKITVSQGQLVTLKYYKEGKDKKYYIEVKKGAMTIIPMVPQN